jgi:hypothetical protein
MDMDAAPPSASHLGRLRSPQDHNRTYPENQTPVGGSPSVYSRSSSSGRSSQLNSLDAGIKLSAIPTTTTTITTTAPVIRNRQGSRPLNSGNGYIEDDAGNGTQSNSSLAQRPSGSGISERPSQQLVQTNTLETLSVDSRMTPRQEAKRLCKELVAVRDELRQLNQQLTALIALLRAEAANSSTSVISNAEAVHQDYEALEHLIDEHIDRYDSRQPMQNMSLIRDAKQKAERSLENFKRSYKQQRAHRTDQANMVYAQLLEHVASVAEKFKRINAPSPSVDRSPGSSPGTNSDHAPLSNRIAIGTPPTNDTLKEP